MPKVTAQRHHHKLRAAGLGRAADSHSVSRRGQRLLRFPGRRLRLALHLHFDRSARRGRKRQAGGPLLDRALRRRRRRFHARSWAGAGACERLVARRRDGTVAREQISRAGQVPVAAQRLDQDRPVPQGFGRGLADHRQGTWQCPGHDHTGIFPWCFTPELYAAKPDYIDQLAAFVRSRPKQPLDAFLRQSNAVIAHDALASSGTSRRRRRSPSAATTSSPRPASPTR